MCEICRRIPCASGCPNAPEPKPVEYCYICEEGIYPGDQFFSTPDGCVCEECLDNFTTYDWLELMGEKLDTAEEE